MKGLTGLRQTSLNPKHHLNLKSSLIFKLKLGGIEYHTQLTYILTHLFIEVKLLTNLFLQASTELGPNSLF